MGFPPPNLGRWIWLMVAALALAIVSAVLLARRRRDYAPIAIGLVCEGLLSALVALRHHA